MNYTESETRAVSAFRANRENWGAINLTKISSRLLRTCDPYSKVRTPGDRRQHTAGTALRITKM